MGLEINPNRNPRWDLDLPRSCAVRREVACLACGGPASLRLQMHTSWDGAGKGQGGAGPLAAPRSLKKGDQWVGAEHLLSECPHVLFAFKQAAAAAFNATRRREAAYPGAEDDNGVRGPPSPFAALCEGLRL